MELYDLVIIGSGPAGYTAGIYAGRADLKPVLFGGEQFGGQLMNTTVVENWPGTKEGIMGPELMMEMRSQAEKFGTKMVDKFVTAVDFQSNPFKIWTYRPEGSSVIQLLQSGTDEDWQNFNTEVRKQPADYEVKSVIIATGAVSRFLGVPGEQRLLGRGVATCAVCDAAFYREKEVFVVGGGDAAIEDTLALTKFARTVTMIVRREELRASKIMASRAMDHPKVKILWNSGLVEILGESKVEELRITDYKSGTQNNVKADGVFLAIGHVPVTRIFKGEAEMDEKGFLVTRMGLGKHGIDLASNNLNEDGLLKYPTMTSVEGVFGAGDVVDFRYRQAVTSAAMGCQSAIDAEKWLEENK